MITPKNLLQHEIIGLKLRVVRSTNKALTGLEGKVIGETQNMVKIETEKGEVSLQKDICTLEFRIMEQKVQVNGALLKRRPQDRIKKW